MIHTRWIHTYSQKRAKKFKMNVGIAISDFDKLTILSLKANYLDLKYRT